MGNFMGYVSGEFKDYTLSSVGLDWKAVVV